MTDTEFIYDYIRDHGPVSIKSERLIAWFQKHRDPENFDGKSLREKVSKCFKILYSENLIKRHHTGRGGLMAYYVN